MKYRVGDLVRFANVAGGGLVMQILDNFIYQIEDDNGFVNNYHQSQLILDQSKPEYYTKPIKTNKDYISKVIVDSKKKQILAANVDLHLHKNPSNLNNTELLRIQINMFQTAINTALLEKQHEITIIHGIGKGTLKKAIVAEIAKNRNILNYVEVSEGSIKVVLKKNI